MSAAIYLPPFLGAFVAAASLISPLYGQLGTISTVPAEQILATTSDYVIWQEDGATKVPVSAPGLFQPGRNGNPLRLAAARHEFEPIQIVITGRSRRPLRYGGIRFADLRRAGGSEIISAGNFRVHLVGYIRDKTPGLAFPDVLFPDKTWNTVADGENYNLWVVLYVPKSARAGEYSGSVSVAIDGRTHTFPVLVHVWDFTLHDQTHVWTQLWGVKWFDVVRQYDLDPWSDAYEELYRNTADMYTRYRFSPDGPTPVPFALFGNPPQWEQTGGIHGRFARFDGVENKITVPLYRGLNLDDAFTLMAWLRPVPSAEKRQDIVASMTFGGYRLSVGHGVVEMTCGTVTESATVRYPYPADGRWHHVAASFDAGKLALYLDGDPVADAAANFKRIGDQWTDIGVGRGYRGDLDDLKIYSHALEAKLIKRAMGTGTLAGGTSPIIAYDFEADPAAMTPINMYSTASIAYFNKWCRFWKDRGLFVGSFPLPGGTEENVLRRFVAVYYPVIRELGLDGRTHVRLPADEATDGPDVERNISYAKMFRAIAPGLKLHQTFGGLQSEAPAGGRPLSPLEVVKQYEGSLDMWDFRPDVVLNDPPLSQFFANRVQRGEDLVWYVNPISQVNNYGNVFRVFCWLMQHHNVTALSHWGTTLWFRPLKVTQRESTIWRERRGFGITSGVGAGNGSWFWPGEKEILPSIRAETLRDGIEDKEYCWLLKQLLGEMEKAGDKGRYAALIGQTKQALTVDPEVLAMLYRDRRASIRYPTTDDTKAIYRQRAKVAEQIEKVQRALGTQSSPRR